MRKSKISLFIVVFLLVGTIVYLHLGVKDPNRVSTVYALGFIWGPLILIYIVSLYKRIKSKKELKELIKTGKIKTKKERSLFKNL